MGLNVDGLAEIIRSEVKKAVNELHQQTYYRGEVVQVNRDSNPVRCRVVLEGEQIPSHQSANNVHEYPCLESYQPSVGDTALILSMGRSRVNMVAIGRLSVEEWKPMTLLNNWENYGSDWQPASYRKDSMGFVHLRGLVRNGTTSTLATMPVGYRPHRTEHMAGMVSSSSTSPHAGQVRVDYQTGSITLVGQSGASWYTLGGCTYEAVD